MKTTFLPRNLRIGVPLASDAELARTFLDIVGFLIVLGGVFGLQSEVGSQVLASRWNNIDKGLTLLIPEYPPN